MLQLMNRIVAERRVEVPIHPLETRVDVVLANGLVNRGNGGEPRIPDRLRMSASKPFHEVAQTRVGHHRQVRAGVSRVDRGTTIAFEHDDAFAALASRYAVLRPVIPAPTTRRRLRHRSASFANCGNVVDVDQYGMVSLVVVAIVISFQRPVSACDAANALLTVGLGRSRCEQPAGSASRGTPYRTGIHRYCGASCVPAQKSGITPAGELMPQREQVRPHHE